MRITYRDGGSHTYPFPRKLIVNKGSVWIGADPRWPEVADYEDPDRFRQSTG